MNYDLQNILSIGILANEHSRRTPENKALFKIGDKTFIERLICEFREFDDVKISCTNKDSYKYKTVEDENHNIGPIEGIRQILKHANHEYVFICAADMPYLTKEIALYLSEYISSDFDCYLFKNEKIQTMCGIYSKKVLPVIEDLIEQEKYCLLEIYDKVKTKYINFDNTRFSRKQLKNINTIEDYKKMNFPIIFNVCGKKNSGKTTLTCRLIEYFKKNYKVGSIKHDAHNYVMDHEGKDSWKHAQAGSEIVSIYNDDKYSVNVAHSPNIEKLIEWQANQVEILIIEGWKDSPYPKVEVVRDDTSVVKNPIFTTSADEDIEKIANKILEYFNVL